MLLFIALGDICAVLSCALAYWLLDDSVRALRQGLAPTTDELWKRALLYGWIAVLVLTSIAAIIESYWPSKSGVGFVGCLAPLVIMALGTLAVLHVVGLNRRKTPS